MYKKVLVPLDGSTMAECTLDHVRRLAKLGAIAEITLLQVLESPTSGFWATGVGNLIEQHEAEYEQHAKTYLSRVQVKLAAEGISSEIEVLVNYQPSSAIVQYAEENDMELIILSSQGHSGVMRWVFGSVALRVLHDTTVPVLLIRPDREQTAA
jgi:nucleotide-binding universal stress UspA family protein